MRDWIILALCLALCAFGCDQQDDKRVEAPTVDRKTLPEDYAQLLDDVDKSFADNMARFNDDSLLKSAVTNDGLGHRVIRPPLFGSGRVVLPKTRKDNPNLKRVRDFTPYIPLMVVSAHGEPISKGELVVDDPDLTDSQGSIRSCEESLARVKESLRYREAHPDATMDPQGFSLPDKQWHLKQIDFEKNRMKSLQEQLAHAEAVSRKLTAIVKKVMLPAKQGRFLDGKVIVDMRMIPAQQKCLSCHPGIKEGEAIGYLTYLYPTPDGDPNFARVPGKMGESALP